MKNNRKLSRLLTVVLAIAPVLGGCSRMVPAYDESGRYIGEQRVDDPGKTLSVLGALNGGLLGLGIQAAGGAVSADQQRQIDAQRSAMMQKQIDTLARQGVASNRGYTLPWSGPSIVMSREKFDELVSENPYEIEYIAKPAGSDAFGVRRDEAFVIAPADAVNRLRSGRERPPITYDNQLEIQVSSTMGVAPMEVGFSIVESLGRGSYYLWAANGRPISNSMGGRTILSEPGTYEFSVFGTDENGATYNSTEIVEVLPNKKTEKQL